MEASFLPILHPGFLGSLLLTAVPLSLCWDEQGSRPLPFGMRRSSPGPYPLDTSGTVALISTCKKQKCLQALPVIPAGAKSPQIVDHWSKQIRTIENRPLGCWSWRKHKQNSWPPEYHAQLHQMKCSQDSYCPGLTAKRRWFREDKYLARPPKWLCPGIEFQLRSNSKSRVLPANYNMRQYCSLAESCLPSL